MLTSRIWAILLNVAMGGEFFPRFDQRDVGLCKTGMLANLFKGDPFFPSDSSYLSANRQIIHG